MWTELGAVGLLPLLDPPSLFASSVDNRLVDETAANDAAAAAAAGTDGDSATISTREDAGGDGGGGSWAEAYLYPADVDPALLDGYIAALEHPRFGPIGLENGGVSEGAGGGGNRRRTAVVETVIEEECMRAVAVHHVACYLFPPTAGAPCPRREGNGEKTPLSSSPARDSGVQSGGGGGGDGGGERVGHDDGQHGRADSAATVWRPDFGRRQRLERLLRLGRGKGQDGRERRDGESATSAGSVAAAVLGHECRGTAVVSEEYSCCLGSDVSKAREQQQQQGEGDGGMNAAAVSSPRPRLPRSALGGAGAAAGTGATTCSRMSRVGRGRLLSLQAYYSRGSGASTTRGAVGGGAGTDVAAWLGEQEERGVEDVVEHLCRAALR